MCENCVEPLTRSYIEVAAEIEYEKTEPYFKYLEDMGVTDAELEAYNKKHQEKPNV